MKYPFQCPIYSINIKLGMILSYCISILNINGSVQINKNIHFPAYTVFPFLSGRCNTTNCPFLPTRQMTDKKRGVDYIYVCAHHEIIIKFG